MIIITSIIVFIAGSAKMLHETFVKSGGCGVGCAACKKCSTKSK